jgi:hypothetical protein
MIGASLKNFENFSASKVAEEIMIFIYGLSMATSLIRVNKMSVCRDLSCASSTIITEYDAKSGSSKNYLSNIPSVIYFMTVLGDVLSSKRTA